MSVRTPVAATLAAATVAASAVASSAPAVPWTRKDMTTAVKALRYPKPGARRLACRGLATPDTIGRFASFRCIATYRHHRRRVFYIAGQGEGGWLCAGTKLAGCKLLRRGFVTAAQVNTEGLDGAADLAARGWMTNHYGAYQVTHLCKATGTFSWSCAFSAATITVSMKAAKGGYLLSATAD